MKQTKEVKSLPHSIEAEETLLAILIAHNEIFDKISKYIEDPKIFYNEYNAETYRIIQNLIKDKVQADYVTISARVKDKYKDYITAFWLTGLEYTSIGQAESYAKLIYEKYVQRNIIKETEKIKNIAYDDTEKFIDVVNQVRKFSDDFISVNPTQEFDLKELSKNTIKSLGDSKNLVHFGYNLLDKMAGGMTRGEITVVAGRPGHGKTTFAVNLIPHLLKQNMKILVINREMTNEEMMKKLIVLMSQNLSYHNIRIGNISKIDYEEIDGVIKEIHKFENKLYMYDDVNTLTDTISIITQIKPDIIIDDYIQLVKVQGKDARRFEIESVMQEYKWIAKKYKCIPILVSQLNRNIETRIDPIPKMSDLAEGSSIEQVAENVLFVYYDYKVHYNKSELGKHKSQIVASKVRYGTSGMFTIGFNGDRVRFHEDISSLEYTKQIAENIVIKEEPKEFKRAMFQIQKGTFK